MIPYNPERYATGLGFLRIIFALRGTVIPHVVKSGIFWFTLVSHAVFHVVEFLWSGLDISDYSWSGLASSDTASRDKLPRLPWEVGTASLTLCIFFLVFYTNSMHQRFQEFHSHVIGIGGHTMVWVGLVRMHLVPSPRVAAAGSTAAAREEVANRTWNAVRHVLGAMQVFYYTINSTGVRYKELDLQGVDDFEWQTMIERGVVGAREARWLARYAGFKPWLLLSWGLVEVGTQIDGLAASAPAGADATSAREALRRRVLAGLVEEFRASACALRFHMGQINALREMQTPFPYFHMLNLLLVLNLLLLAYISVPLCAWPLSSFIVTIMAIYLLGMRAIAIKLADPFGTNRLDFDLESIMRACYSEAVAQLSMQKTPTSLCNLPDGMEAGKPIHNPILVAQEEVQEQSGTSSPISSPELSAGRLRGVTRLRPSWRGAAPSTVSTVADSSAAAGPTPSNAATPSLESPAMRGPASPSNWLRPDRDSSGNAFSNLKRMQTACGQVEVLNIMKASREKHQEDVTARWQRPVAIVRSASRMQKFQVVGASCNCTVETPSVSVAESEQPMAAPATASTSISSTAPSPSPLP